MGGACGACGVCGDALTCDDCLLLTPPSFSSLSLEKNPLSILRAQLLPFLETLHGEQDVRPTLQREFQLQERIDAAGSEQPAAMQ